MFVTNIAYDYFKAMVTAFIEINGRTETALGNPPVKKLLFITNIVVIVEWFLYLIFTCLLIAVIATDFSFSWWAVFWPLEVLMGVSFLFMLGLYIFFSITMFRHGKSVCWKICFVAMVPLGLVNVLLFFGCMFIATLFFPLQKETTVWLQPKAYDITLFVFLGLFGALLKSFVRPTEDDDNPYAEQTPSKWAAVIYFFFVLGIAAFVFLLTAKIDSRVPLSSTRFTAHWVLVFLPYYVVMALALGLMATRAVIAIKTVRKRKDPTGDQSFKAIQYCCLSLFLLCLLITGIVINAFLVRRETARVDNIQYLGAVIPCIIANLTGVFLSLVPFIFKSKFGRANDEEGQKENQERRLMSSLL